MSFSQQQTLLAEERAYQEKQERERRVAAEDSETARLKREADERERIKNEEAVANKLTADAEREAIIESSGQDSVEGKRGTIGGQNESMLDFYSSLYKGSKI
jgi:hypothetical protein